MTRGYLPILLFMLIIAIIFRDDFVFILVYVFIGTYLIGGIWVKRAVKHVQISRNIDTHAFLGEKIAVRLEINNKGLLPIPWLRIHERMPAELSISDNLQRVISLGPKQKNVIEYQITPKKRGYYRVGPLSMRTGDLFGVSEDVVIDVEASSLTVYPRIVPLESLALPSRSPTGTLGFHQPIFDDPSRIFGKRDYSPGDSIRKIDWKSTASSRKMQVKLFEPSIDLDIMTFLDLDGGSYPLKTRYMAGELAVTVAASIAAWGTSRGQSIGLASNGTDELNPGVLSCIPTSKGSLHLMSVLEVLARLTLQETVPLIQLFENFRGKLRWGTTLVIVSGEIRDSVWREIIEAQKTGLEVVIYIVGFTSGYEEVKAKADRLRIKTTRLAHEVDLEHWQSLSQARVKINR